MEGYVWLLIPLALVVFWFLDNWHAGWAWKQAKKEADELMKEKK